MKPVFIAEWLAAIGIIVYRSVKQTHAPPMPGSLLATSGLFVMLAVMADTGPNAERAAVLFGAGIDIAAFMNLFQQFGPPAAGQGGSAAGEGSGGPLTSKAPPPPRTVRK